MGVTLASPSPVFKSALYELNLRWPRSASFDELTDIVARSLGSDGTPAVISEEDRLGLGHNLIQGIANGLLDIKSAPDSFVTTISERPLASNWARTEARAGLKVTSRRHVLVDVDQTTKHVLCYLDGRHDREAILHEMVAAARRGDVSILVDGIPASGGEALTQIIRDQLDEALAKLARHAMLIA